MYGKVNVLKPDPKMILRTTMKATSRMCTCDV
jgi:hypothetical protein